MSTIAVTKQQNNNLFALRLQPDSLLGAFQSAPSTWGPLNSGFGEGFNQAFAAASLSVGDNGPLHVAGALEHVINPDSVNVRLFTHTANPTSPVQLDTAVLPASNLIHANILALGAAGQIMIAERNQGAALAVQNNGNVTRQSWVSVPAPFGEQVRDLAIATSTLTGPRQEAFMVTNTAVSRSILDSSGVWSPFTRIASAKAVGGIAVCRNANSLVDVLAIGNEGAVFHAHQTTAGFADWVRLPTPGQPPLGLAHTSDNITVARVLGGPGTLLTVFVLGSDGQVRTAQQAIPDGNTWNAWLPLPHAPAPVTFTSVSVEGTSTRFVEVLAFGTDGKVYHSQRLHPAFCPGASWECRVIGGSPGFQSGIPACGGRHWLSSTRSTAIRTTPRANRLNI